MRQKIRAIQNGFGVVGQQIVRFILEKKTIECVGAVDNTRTDVGKDLGEILGTGRKMGVILDKDLDDVLSRTKADVFVDATRSHTKAVFPHIMKAIEAGLNVVTICEEMANPSIHEPELAKKLDEAAKKHNVTVVGTGLNPGYYLDVIPVTLAGALGKVKAIRVDRVLDLGDFVSSYVGRAFGLGLTLEEVNKKLNDGSVTLHVGLPETIYQVAEVMGWVPIEVREEREALISKIVRDYPPFLKVEPGQCYGCRYDGYGIYNGEEVISLKGVLSLKPTLETDGMEPHFTLTIEGEPTIKITAEGFTTAGNPPLLTAGHAVNWIPYVIKAKPGVLSSMLDFPLVGPAI